MEHNKLLVLKVVDFDDQKLRSLNLHVARPLFEVDHIFAAEVILYRPLELYVLLPPLVCIVPHNYKCIVVSYYQPVLISNVGEREQSGILLKLSVSCYIYYIMCVLCYNYA